jgi:EAL domain-containing protein (putative c-di-GMP-specific phosphodiesterase class I)
VARLLAEGIKKRADLRALRSLGVELGQGFLLGRPSTTPQPPRPVDRPIRSSGQSRRMVSAHSIGR